MKRAVILFSLLWLISLPSLAHEHWLLVEKIRAHPGEIIKFYLASGHNFPNSDLQIAQKLIKEVKVILPSGQKQELKLNPGKNYWWGEIELEEKGVYQFYFLLSKPQLKKPLYLGKAIIAVGESPSKISALNLKEDIIELVPLTSPLGLKKGDILKLMLRKGEKPIAGSIQVIPEEGKSWYIQTDAQGRVEIPLRKSGKYLVVAEIQGQGCSFTFEVKEGKNEK